MLLLMLSMVVILKLLLSVYTVYIQGVHKVLKQAHGVGGVVGALDSKTDLASLLMLSHGIFYDALL